MVTTALIILLIISVFLCVIFWRKSRTNKLSCDRQILFERLAENSPNWVWQIDLKGRFVYSNKAAKKILGYEAQEVVGKYYFDLFPKQEINKAKERILEIIDKKTFFSGAIKVNVTKQGKEVILETTGMPMLDKQGTLIGYGGIDRDITENKKIEAAFQLSGEYLDKIINSIADPIFVKDRQHHWVLLNEAHANMFGIPTADMLGKTDYDYFPKEQAKVFWDKDEVVFENGQENINEELWTDSKGFTHTIVTKKTLYTNKKGEKFIVGIIRDITDLKIIEAKLKEAMEIRSRFTSIVSHELRTPLAAIRTGVNLIVDGLAGDINREQKEFLEIVKKNIDRLSRLINDILDFQKLDSGKMHFKMEKNNIGEVIAEVSKSMKPLLEKKMLSLDIELAESAQEFVFDRDRITQVLVNLINNAIDFTETGGIKIITNLEGGDLHISVIDTGVGIKQESLLKIFNPFEQAERQDSGKREGTGLGLAICREIITRHDGKIWAESNERGSVFHIVLPIKR